MSLLYVCVSDLQKSIPSRTQYTSSVQLVEKAIIFRPSSGDFKLVQKEEDGVIIKLEYFFMYYRVFINGPDYANCVYA